MPDNAPLTKKPGDTDNDQMAVETEEVNAPGAWSGVFGAVAGSSNPVMRKAGLATMNPHQMSHDRILSLQRTLGNQAVGSWLKRNSHSNIMREGEGEEEGPSQQPELPASGTHAPVEVPPNPELEVGHQVWQEDSSSGKMSANHNQAASNQEQNDKGSGDLVIGESNVGFRFANPERNFNQVPKSSLDTLTTTNATSITFNNPETLTVTPFGAASYDPAIKDINYKVIQAPGSDSYINQAASYLKSWFVTENRSLTLDFTLDVHAPWGVIDGGRKDVPSATDSSVSNAKLSNGKKAYEQIYADLNPTLIEKSWRAARSVYWSKAICQRHELYHTRDMKSWSEGLGKNFIENYLKGKTVSAKTLDADLDKLFKSGIIALRAAFMAWFKGGETSYLSFAGEERAFGDGKQPYMDLASDIKTQGESMDAADALKATPPSAGSGSPTTTPPTTTTPSPTTTTPPTTPSTPIIDEETK